MEKLALLGGDPVRTSPFRSPAVIDEDEKKEILSVLESEEFSRFIGSPSEDIDDLLVMKSADAYSYKTKYFTFLGGRKIREFERDFAVKFGVDYAITVNSATSGLASALAAVGIEPGDEVITTSLSFNATAMSILHMNAIPRFVDISSDDFCLDPDDIEKKITPKTKVILVVHLLGNSADMDRILAIAKKYDLKVVEDCAQSPGVKYKGQSVGTIGDVGIYSFQETKNIMTGEGGMVVTNNPEYARKCRLIRNHGESIPNEDSDDSLLVNNLGFNFRMTELTAAMGIAQLKKLDENNRVRQENADYLIERLKDIKGLKAATQRDGGVYHVLPFIYSEEEVGVPRINIIHALRAEGVPVGTGYLKLMYEYPVFLKKTAYGTKGCPFTCSFGDGKVEYKLGDTPVSSSFIREKFIWFYHLNRPNTLEDMEQVADAFIKVFTNLEGLKKWSPPEAPLTYKW